MFFIKKGKIALMGAGLMARLMGPGEHFSDPGTVAHPANRTDQAVALAAIS
jgi:hypothetical protein